VIFFKTRDASTLILNGLFLDEVGQQSGAYFMSISVIKELLNLDERYRIITTEEFDWAEDRSIKVPKFKKKYRFFYESLYRNIYNNSMWLHFDYFLPYQMLGMTRNNIVIIHDLLPLDIPGAVPFLKEKWFRYQVKRTLSKCESVITISEFCKKRFEVHFPGSSHKISVIPNPIDTDRFISSKAASEELTKMSYFITVAAPWPHKNLRTVIDAVDDTFQEKGIPLYICGTRSKQFLDLKESDSFRFLGFLSDEELGAVIANAKLMIAPSLYEGFGMTVYEGLALGKFVMASDLEVYGDLPNLIKVKNAHSKESWKVAIDSFLTYPPTKQLSNISYLRPNVIAEKYNEIIKKYEISYSN
jgi:glycosyltransferase involved in cell wall biosynthesis